MIKFLRPALIFSKTFRHISNSFTHEDHSIQRRVIEYECPCKNPHYRLLNACDDNSDIVPIRVVSYNILAQHHLENNSHLYTHCDPRFLSWQFRRENLIRELENLDADILCLQEVQDNHFDDFFQPHLERLGYSSFYHQKTRGKRDGVSIAFKRDKFIAIKHLPISYYLFTRATHPLLDSDNVGLLLLLRLKSECQDLEEMNHTICIANTHLFFNPNRGDLKLAQLCILLREADHFIRYESKESDSHSSTSSSSMVQRYPLLLCGDFNSEPFSPLLKFLRGGNLLLNETRICDLSAQQEVSLTHPLVERMTPLCNIDFPDLIADMTRKLVMADPHLLSENVSEETILRHPFEKLWDVYHLVYQQHYKLRGGSRLATSYTSEGSRSVDYIMCTHPCSKMIQYFMHGALPSHVQAGPRLCLRAFWSLLTHEQISGGGGLPNQWHSSDHIPLVTDLLFHIEKFSV